MTNQCQYNNTKIRLHKKIHFNQNGAIPILLLVTALGLLAFLLVSNTIDFRNKLFSGLFPKPSSFAASSFELLGTHPYASQQPTARGKILLHLFGWNGKLYIGYGDYGVNTGPIYIAPYDPASGSFLNLGSASTEEIHNYRSFGNNIFAPAIDPSGGLPDYAYARGEPWQNPTATGVNAAHVFDINTLNSSDLYVAGSSGNNAAVWKSLDSGTTWTKILDVSPVSGIVGDFARFYFAGVFNGKLYVQGRDYYGSRHPKSKIYDGTNWTDGPNMFPDNGGLGYRPVLFAGKLIYGSWQPGSWQSLIYFDGNQAQIESEFYIYDFVIDGGFLYALKTDGQIIKTADLTSWSVYATSPANSSSLGFLDGVMYVGTNDSKLYRLNPGASPTPSVTDSSPPTISITSPENEQTVARSTVVNISATATDDIKVERVDFLVDNSIICSDNTPSYSCDWRVSGKKDGVYTIEAKAFDGGNNMAKDSIKVYVGSGGNVSSTPTPVPDPNAETNPPNVTILEPQSGSLVQRRSTVTLTAEASDDSGISKLEFFVDGTIVCSKSSSPYSCNWNVPAKPGIAYTITAEATDIYGNRSSDSITVSSQ